MNEFSEDGVGNFFFFFKSAPRIIAAAPGSIDYSFPADSDTTRKLNEGESGGKGARPVPTKGTMQN